MSRRCRAPKPASKQPSNGPGQSTDGARAGVTVLDTINLNVLASSASNVGGYVNGSGGYSNVPSATITGDADTSYSYVVFDLSSLPSYALDLLQHGATALKVQMQAHTSSNLPVTIKAFAAGETFADGSTYYTSVVDQVAHPSSSNAQYATGAFAAHSSSPVYSWTVKKGLSGLSSDQNENVTQTVDITTQALKALNNGDSKVVVYFSASGAALGVSTNITAVSASLSGPVPQADAYADANTTSLVGSIVTHPFSAVSLASTVPSSLVSGNLVIGYENAGATSEPFQDFSTGSVGVNTYFIIQNIKVSGVLSGSGLTVVTNPIDPVNGAAYSFSGTAAQATALLQNLVFTPSSTAPSLNKATTFTITEGSNLFPGTSPGAAILATSLGVVSINTGGVTGKTIGGGATQLVTTGGVATNTYLDGYGVGDSSGARLLYGTQTVTSGGQAVGTTVRAGIVNVQSGGTSTNTVLQNGGAFGINSLSSPSQENVYSGGLAYGTSIASGASQAVLSGGVANATSVNSGGLQTVGAGASARATHVYSGGVETVQALGVSQAAVIDKGGVQNVSGAADGAQVAGTQNVTGSTTKTTVLAGGVEALASSASAKNVSLQGAGATLSLAAGASADQVSAGAGTSVTAAGTARITGLSGSGSLLVSSGVVSLGGSSNFQGATTVKGGTLFLTDPTSHSSASSTLAMNGGVLETGYGFMGRGAVTLLSNGTVQVDGGAATLAGQISGVGTLTKTGAGLLTLSGVNTFTGGTFVNAGTLAVAADAALGGDIQLNGGVLEATASFATTRRVALNASSTIQVDTGAVLDLSTRGVIGGQKVALAKTGAGTLVLGGANVSTTISVSAGVLSVSKDAALGAAGYAVNLAGGTLEATSGFASSHGVMLASASTVQVDAGVLSLSGVVSGTGALTKAGAGTLLLSGANTFTGGVTLLSGVLELAAAGSASGGFAFSTGAQTLKLDAGTSLDGVKSFGFGDTLDFARLAYDPNATAELSNGVLTITSGGAKAVVSGFTLASDVSLTGANASKLIVDTDGASGSVVYLQSSPIQGSGGGGYAAVPVSNPILSFAAGNSALGAADVNAAHAAAADFTVGGLSTSASGVVAFTGISKATGLTTTVSASVVNGPTSVDLSAFQDGAVTVTLTAREVTGGVTTTTSSIILDATPPTVAFTSPAVSGTQAARTVTGTVTAGGPAGVAGQTVTLTDNGSPIATAKVQSDGIFSIPVTLNAAGSHALIASVTDTFGNAAASAPLLNVLQPPAPAPTLAGASPSQSTTAETPLSPFATLVLNDTADAAKDTLTITQAGAGVLRDGSGFSGLTQTTPGVYVLSGSPADVTAELQALVFTPAASATAGAASTTAGAASTTGFVVSALSAAGLPTDPITISVTDIAAPRPAAPTFTGVAPSQSTTAEVPLAPFSTVVLGDFNVGAVDTVTIVQNGTGALRDGAGFNGLTKVSAGIFTLTGTPAAVTAELEALVFTPAAATAPGSLSVTSFVLTDASSAGPSSSAVTVSVTDTAASPAPAQAPSFGGVAASLNLQAGATVAPFATVTLTDAAAGAVETVTIVQTGGGVLRDGAGFSGLTSPSAGVYTLKGTPTAVTAELEALVFTPVAAAAGASATTSFALSDLSSTGAASATATVGVTVGAVNTAPKVTAGAPSNGLIEAGAAGAGVSHASVVLNPTDLESVVSYVTSKWTSLGGGVYAYNGVYGTAQLDTVHNTLSYDLDNARPRTQALADGAHVRDTFTVTVSDGQLTGSTIVNFAITGASHAPAYGASASLGGSWLF